MTPNELIIEAMFYIEAGIDAEGKMPSVDRDMHFIAAHSLIQRARQILCRFDVTPYPDGVSAFMASVEGALLIDRAKRDSQAG